MPALFYGTLGTNPERRLYGDGMRPVSTGVFDGFKIEDLAPYSGTYNIANFWWIRKGKVVHSVFSWHDARGIEQTVFLPGAYNWREALIAAREAFPFVIPSAITFRLNKKNYKGWIFTYD